MLNPKIALLPTSLCIALLAGPAAAQDPFGNWVRPSTGTQVQFYDCGGKLCAKIVAVKDESKKGTIGTVIMKGAEKTGPGQWKGDLLNTEDGKTYSGKVTLDGKGLKLEGCVALVLCKGETWTKIN